MFGAALVEPVNPDADLGVIFLSTGDYPRAYPYMCGHGTIGLISAAVELGMVKKTEPLTKVLLDTPDGLVTGWATVRNDQVINIEATIEIIDVEMGKEPEYLTVGKTPLERVHKLLSKLDSIRRSKERGSVVLAAEKDLSNKFIGQVESIFKNLPKPLKWQSFLMNDLILLTDIPLNVQTASVKHGLNKAQTKALARLEQVSGKVFHDVTQKGSIPFKDQNNTLGRRGCGCRST